MFGEWNKAEGKNRHCVGVRWGVRGRLYPVSLQGLLNRSNLSIHCAKKATGKVFVAFLTSPQLPRPGGGKPSPSAVEESAALKLLHRLRPGMWQRQSGTGAGVCVGARSAHTLARALTHRSLMNASTGYLAPPPPRTMQWVAAYSSQWPMKCTSVNALLFPFREAGAWYHIGCRIAESDWSKSRYWHGVSDTPPGR